MQHNFLPFEMRRGQILLLCFAFWCIALADVAVEAQMPQLDKARFVTPKFTSEPFQVGRGKICVDSNQRYVLVNKFGGGKNVMTVFDLQNGHQVKEIEFGAKSGEAVSISPDLSRLLFKPTAGKDLYLFDVSAKPRELSLIHI